MMISVEMTKNRIFEACRKLGRENGTIVMSIFFSQWNRDAINENIFKRFSLLRDIDPPIRIVDMAVWSTLYGLRPQNIFLCDVFTDSWTNEKERS